jgi:hypothetical protein
VLKLRIRSGGSGAEAGKPSARPESVEIIQPFINESAASPAAPARIEETFNATNAIEWKLESRAWTVSIMGLWKLWLRDWRNIAESPPHSLFVRLLDGFTKASENRRTGTLHYKTLMTNANQLVEAIAGTQQVATGWRNIAVDLKVPMYI